MIPAPEQQRWHAIDPGGHPRPAIVAANVVLAAAAVALCARVSVPVPGTDVPQSLQTLAVVLAGFWLGPVWGPTAMIFYAAAGWAGLPVFADGASGVGVLLGPTGGYLAGFVLGAGLAGLSSRRPWISAFVGFAWMALLAAVGHAAILAAGWARLSMLVGASEAWSGGVAPFLLGGLFKSIAAAGIWAFWEMSRPPD